MILLTTSEYDYSKYIQCIKKMLKSLANSKEVIIEKQIIKVSSKKVHVSESQCLSLCTAIRVLARARENDPCLLIWLSAAGNQDETSRTKEEVKGVMQGHCIIGFELIPLAVKEAKEAVRAGKCLRRSDSICSSPRKGLSQSFTESSQVGTPVRKKRTRSRRGSKVKNLSVCQTPTSDKKSIFDFIPPDSGRSLDFDTIDTYLNTEEDSASIISENESSLNNSIIIKRKRKSRVRKNRIPPSSKSSQFTLKETVQFNSYYILHKPLIIASSQYSGIKVGQYKIQRKILTVPVIINFTFRRQVFRPILKPLNIIEVYRDIFNIESYQCSLEYSTSENSSLMNTLEDSLQLRFRSRENSVTSRDISFISAFDNDRNLLRFLNQGVGEDDNLAVMKFRNLGEKLSQSRDANRKIQRLINKWTAYAESQNKNIIKNLAVRMKKDPEIPREIPRHVRKISQDIKIMFESQEEGVSCSACVII